jgi:hypothetical protein
MTSKPSRKAKSVLPFIGALALTLTPLGFIAYGVLAREDPAARPLADSKYITFFKTHRSFFQAAEKILSFSPLRAPNPQRRTPCNLPRTLNTEHLTPPSAVPTFQPFDNWYLFSYFT